MVKYNCDKCGKEFAQKSHYTQHINKKNPCVYEENIEKMKLNLAASFCKSYLANSQELEGGCNQLTESNCAQTSCCVFTKTGENSKCVAGSLDGPTYKTDKDGKLITMDSYYYLGKCRGSCPT